MDIVLSLLTCRIMHIYPIRAVAICVTPKTICLVVPTEKSVPVVVENMGGVLNALRDM